MVIQLNKGVICCDTLWPESIKVQRNALQLSMGSCPCFKDSAFLSDLSTIAEEFCTCHIYIFPMVAGKLCLFY